MLHDVFILVFCFSFSHKNHKDYLFLFISQKGTLTLTPGMGMGRGPFRTPKSPKILRTKMVHTSGAFFQISQTISKHTFKICSLYTQNTKNPSPIVKITIYYTRTSKTVKIYLTFSKNKNEHFE